MKQILLALARWCHLMADIIDDPDWLYYNLTPQWWLENHRPYNESIIANLTDEYEYYPDLGWVPIPPF